MAHIKGLRYVSRGYYSYSASDGDRWTVCRGNYEDTGDDCADRWYADRDADSVLDHRGDGFGSRGAAVRKIERVTAEDRYWAAVTAARAATRAAEAAEAETAAEAASAEASARAAARARAEARAAEEKYWAENPTD